MRCKRHPTVPVQLALLLIFAAFSGVVGAEGVWVVNPASEVPLLPASYADVRAAVDRPLAAGRDGRMLPADTYKKRHYVLAGDVPALGAVRVSVGEGEPLSPMSVEETDDGVAVATDSGTWVFGRNGRWQLRKSSIELASPAMGRMRVRYRGSAMVVLLAADRQFELRVFRTGVILVEAAKERELGWVGRDGAEASLEADLGYVLPVTRTCELASPRDWCRYGGNWGLHVGWAGATVSVTSRTIRFEGTVALVPVLGGTWTSVRTQAALTPSIVLDSTLTGRYEGFLGTVYVRDRDRDGTPDFDNDLWAFDLATDGRMELVLGCHQRAGDNDGDPDVIHIYRPVQDGLDSLVLALPEGGLWDSMVACLDLGQAAPKERVHRPIMSLIDWNDDGVFLLGSLLSGGYLQQDRVVSRQASATAYDLDGDGDVDVVDRVASAQFDFEDIFVGMVRLHVDPELGVVELCDFTDASRQAMARRGISLYDRTCATSPPQGDVRTGGHELATMFVRRGQTAELPDGASFQLSASAGTVTRIAIGPAESRSAFGWGIELQPIPVGSLPRKPASGTVRYRDVSGHEYAAPSALYPLRWDGRELRWGAREKHGGALSICPNAPWRRATKGEYVPLKGLCARFTREGVTVAGSANASMSDSSWAGRVEHDVDGATFTLYYSSLVGGLHLKGADLGGSTSATGDVGGSPGRCLVYRDADADGYFDTYALDMDVDGVYERVLSYNRKQSFVELQDGGSRAVWPCKAAMEDVPYEIGAYQLIRGFCRRGYSQAPMVERCELASSGIPVERETVVGDQGKLWTTRIRRPPFFFILPDAGAPRAAVYQEEAVSYPRTWRSSSVQGVVPFDRSLLADGVALGELNGPLAAEAMAGLSVLFVRHLGHVLSEAELACLLAWVEEGGILVIGPADSGDEVLRAYFNALGEVVGFQFGEMLTLEQPLTRVTDAQGSTIMGRAGFGKGQVLVACTDALSQHYAELATRSGAGKASDDPVWATLRELMRAVPRTHVSACSYDRERAQLCLAGPGGLVSFPRLWSRREVAVDEREAEPLVRGDLCTVEVSPGEHIIEVRRVGE